MKKSHLPVVFLAFANDRLDERRYLRNLPEELRQLRSRLSKAADQGLCELVIRTNTSLDDLIDVFQDTKYRGRIALFHFGGHAGDYKLLLETARGAPQIAHAGGLAEFLGKQEGLQFVFLNGCSTQPQVEGLLEAGVPAVVATSQSIDDEVATRLSSRFYAALTGGVGLESAFEEAVAAMKMSGERFENRDATPPVTGRNIATPEAELQPERWPWALTVREGSEIVKRWSLPDAAGDPLFGLPPLPENDLPASPYRHLQPYTRDQAQIFFGRGREIRNLYELITGAATAPIVLFYGQSGVGKSSMLDAGLLPRLSLVQEVRYVRRDPVVGAVGSLASVLSLNDPELLTSWIEIENQTKKPLVVILDQVEEMFIQASSDEETAVLLSAIDRIFNDDARRPRGKLVLAFRKEWLAEIEARLEEKKLARTRFYLERLDRNGLLEVITGPTRTERLQQHFGLTLEEGLPEIIADDLLEDRESPLAPTLQVLLAKMWRVADLDRLRFDTHLYQSMKKEGILLDDFIENQLLELQTRFPAESESGLVLDLLSRHTSTLGTAQTRSREEIESMYAHVSDRVTSLMQAMIAGFLLVETTGQNTATHASTRLAHDTLAPLIRRRYRDSDRPGQRAGRILENRAREGQAVATLDPIDEIDLATVESGSMGMPVWNDTERRLIDVSREARTRRYQRKRIMQTMAAAAVLLIAVSSILAWTLRNKAEESAHESQSRYLAARAVEQQDRPGRAALLSVQAFREYPTNLARGSLLMTIQRYPFLSNILNGHEDDVVSVAFSADGTQIASGSQDNTIMIWDSQTKKPIGSPLEGHDAIVWSVAFSPDGRYLASGSRDNTIILWNASTYKSIGEPLDAHEDEVLSVAFSPDSRTLASGSSDNDVILWDVGSGLPIGEPLSVHEAAVLNVAFSPNGDYLASGSADNSVYLWDVSGLEPTGIRLESHKDDVVSVAFSKDSDLLASGGRDGTILLWDVASGELLGALSGHDESVESLAFSPIDENRLVSGSRDDTIILWDVIRREPAAIPLTGHQEDVASIAFSPDGKRLVSGSWDDSVIIWDATLRQHTGNAIYIHEDVVWAVAVSQDGRRLASAGADASIRIWDVEQKQFVSDPMTGHHKSIKSLSFSPDGKILASGSWDHTIMLWDAESGQSLGQPLEAHDDEVWSIAFSSNPEEMLLASGGMDGTVIVWDVEESTVRNMLVGHQGRINSIAFNPDPARHQLASASSDNTIILWNVTEGMASDTLLGHQSGVNAIAYSTDGKLLASGDRNGTILLWDVHTGERVDAVLEGHRDAVWSLDFNQDGSLLASGSRDKTVILWDVATRQPIGVPFEAHQNDVLSLAFSPDGRSLVLGTWDRSVFRWDIDPDLWIEQACDMAQRNLSRREWTQFVGVDSSYTCACPGFPAGDGYEASDCMVQ